MKSPFVRFNQFVRSGLSVAAFGVTALGGCHHLPVTQYADEPDEVACSEGHDLAAVNAFAANGYEELGNQSSDVIDPKCHEQPLVKLPMEVVTDGDVFLPTTPTTRDSSTSESKEKVPAQVPDVTTAKAKSPSEAAVSSEDAPTRTKKLGPMLNADEADTQPTVESQSVEKPKRPTVIDTPANPPKLDVPPEPAPKQESVPDNNTKPRKEKSERPDEASLKSATETGEAALLEEEQFFPLDAATKSKSKSESEFRPLELPTESKPAIRETIKVETPLELPEVPAPENTKTTNESSATSTPEPAKTLPADLDDQPTSLFSRAKLVVRKMLPPGREVAAVSKEPVLPVPPEPVPETVAHLDNDLITLDSYCDGLVFDTQGFGYVSQKSQIIRFSPTGNKEVWATINNSKGHRIEPEGTHLICDLDRRAIVRLSFEGKPIGIAAKECDGAPLRAPYDIAVDPQGGFYFTDPGYVQIKNPIGKLHFVDHSGNVSVVAAKLGYPTGVVFDSARQRVLVAESLFNRIVEFRLSEPGKVESHQVLVELPKSETQDYHLASMGVDAEGNLYVTQPHTKSVHVFDLQGRPVGQFATGDLIPSSITLQSPEADELFLTGEVPGQKRTSRVMRLNLGK